MEMYKYTNLIKLNKFLLQFQIKDIRHYSKNI